MTTCTLYPKTFISTVRFRSHKFVTSNAIHKFSFKKFSVKTCHFKILTLPQKPRLNKTGSSQVGAISKAQKYSKNNYWKHLEKLFFQKKMLKFFFEKSIFLKSRTMPKNSKRGHSGSLNVFTNRKLQKNARGYPLIESENFRKKVA